MPTYVYECETDQQHSYEKIQKISEASDTVCPTCGGPVHRVISGGLGLIFNGSGFYKTDYKSSSSSLTGSTNGSSKKSTAATTTTDSSSNTSNTESKSGGCGTGCSCHS